MSPSQLSYDQALQYIASLAPRGWRLGLDRMEELVDRAGLRGSLGDGSSPMFLHVAGTNGKGSVTAYLQSLMVESGYRTGAFFSPYVYDIRERIQYGRDLISEEDFARIASDLIAPAESLTETEFGGTTEFEFKTAMGFEYWKRRGCEWVALEVGLGGKLDATNVVTPAASVIVSIDLDHTSILGNSVEEIAAEKAGIIKPGKPVVVGRMAPEALTVIEGIAARNGSQIWRYGKEIVVDGDTVSTPAGEFDRIAPSLVGTMQMHNAALALSAFAAAGALTDTAAARRGIANASLPGRFEKLLYKGKTVILDGAHNAAAAKVLADSLRAAYPDKHVLLVTGMVAGHNPVKFYKELAPLVRRAFVVPIDFHRAQPASTLGETLRALVPNTSVHSSPEEGLESALEAAEDDDIVVITGSFYLLGEVMRSIRAH